MATADLDREIQEAQAKEKIKTCFKRLDADGNGVISKFELRQVLTIISKVDQELTDEDIEQCMLEADKNGDGVIQYAEFVDWLSRPAASIQCDDEGKLERYDIGKVLRPLYEVYDRNQDGDISIEEFDECHSILRNALHLHADGEAASTADPDVLLQESAEVFATMDKNKDKKVGFDEFVTFQRTALEKSGIKNSDIEEMVPELTRQLRRVFKMSEREEQGKEIDASDEKLLQHIITDLATFSRELWNTQRRGRTSAVLGPQYANKWEEPPVGLNVNKLKGQHLRRYPCDMLALDKIDMAVLCVPDCAAGEPLTPWYAELVRKITFKNGDTMVQEPVYYQYAKLNWKLMPPGAGSKVSAAAEGLPPELRVFCLLKSEANFGIEISWPDIQAALQASVSRGFLTADQQSKYNEFIHGRMKEAMMDEDADADFSDKEFEAEILSRLHRKFRVRPRHVMATLSELGIFKVSTVWSDFMEGA
jgi:Ca2+-binding EF-hand superfamily protein